MNETIKRSLQQIREIDVKMSTCQKEVEQHQASINRLAPEFNDLVKEKSRLLKLVLNELEIDYPAESKLKVVE